MTQEALKKMYQLLLTEPHAPTVCAQLERIAREALAEHAMREVQRLGQKIEQEPEEHRLLRRKWFGHRDTGHLSFTEAVDETMEKIYSQPKQEPVAWMDVDGNVSDNNDHKCFPIPLYTQPPQRTEQNFCPRCGKRTPDLITIHTCTPPKENA